ncbi:site-2 protease family protein [Pseudomonas nitroreducens]|uniref:site-2 protease family protein n=1 Tax=Pseudomonas nitroreducens TaxID=46680 RepID=UPI002F357141
MAETREVAVHGEAASDFWSLPGWLNGLLWLLQFSLSAAAGALAVLLSMLWLPGGAIWSLSGIVAGLCIVYLSVVVHELGHLLAARWAGMTVLRMRVGRLDVRLLRKGWKLGFAPRTQKRLQGFVMAFADPRAAWRRQHMGFVAGGPLANLILAVLAGALGAWLAPGAAHGMLLAFAACNACIGVANLLPVERKPQVSDGLWLLRWWRGLDVAHPKLAFARLMGAACAGLCADQADPADLQLLEAQGQPMSLLALYIRLRGLLVQGRWEEAAALDAMFQAQRSALPEAMLRPLYDLLRLMETELAFARAMASRSAVGLFDELLPSRLQREYTSTWARCLALRAVLAGDDGELRRQLARGIEHAARSPDLSMEKEEARIQQGMLRFLGG